MILLLGFAFLAGLVTILAPCIWPLLPIVLSTSATGKNHMKPLGVTLGIMLSFTILTLSISYLVSAFHLDPDIVRSIAIVVLIFMGVMMVIPALGRFMELWISRCSGILGQNQRAQTNDFGGGFITGLLLGIVWTPCSGPILATIATLAATGQVTLVVIFITLAYVAGVGIPLFAFAYGGQKVVGKTRFLSAHTGRIQQVFGVLMLVTALALYTNYDRLLQAKLLDAFPAYNQLLVGLETNKTVKNQLDILEGKKSPARPGSIVINNVQLQNDFTGAKVAPGDLIQGCFGQDCIPAITHPRFQQVRDASWMKDNDVIFTISKNGVEKAYPQRILNWHEIVNDTVANKPIAVTFCPLCGSAVAFERKVNGIITEFGVSGKLHDSDLVMYDRYEGNLWQQITGEAIVGPAARRNERLKPILLGTTTWGAWEKDHPDGQVLSRDTGYARDYNQYPYGTYEQDDQLYFGVKKLNKTLPLKTVVIGVEINGAAKAYPQNIFDTSPIVTDTINNTQIRLEKTTSGTIQVTNLQTNQPIIPLRLFWFAWAAFHPDTELYNQ